MIFVALAINVTPSPVVRKIRVDSLCAKGIQQFGATFVNPRIISPNTFVLAR